MYQALTLLDATLQAQRPSFYAQLQPGLSLEACKALEQRYHQRLSKAILGLYQWKNGQSAQPGAFFFSHYRFLPLEYTLAVAQHLTLEQLRAEQRQNWWHPAWIPIFAGPGDSYLCCDQFGVFTGLRGQMLLFLPDAPDRTIMAPNLPRLLQAVNRSLAAASPEPDPAALPPLESFRGYPKFFQARVN